MKNLTLSSALLLLLVPFYSSSAVVVESWVTGNKVPVLFVQVPDIEMVDIHLAFDAGSSRDGVTYGLSNIVSELVLQGAGDLNVESFNEELGLTGGILTSGTSLDIGYIKARSLTGNTSLSAVVRLLKLALSTPRFDRPDVDRVLARTLMELEYKKQSPSAVADENLNAQLFAPHPYGYPRLGTAKTVSSITRDNVVNFFEKFYVSRNLNISIVGALNSREAKRIAEEISSVLSAGSPAEKIPVEQFNAMHSTLVTKNFPSIQSHIRVGARSVGRGHPDYFPLLVANHALGGNSLVSVLFRSIREERGLAYSAYSYFAPKLEGGSLVAALQTDGGSQEEAIEVLDGALEQLRLEGFTQKDIDSAKNNLIGGFALRVDTNGKILNYLAMIGFYGLPLNYLTTFADKVNEITREQASKVFNEYFSPEKRVTVVIGSRQAGDE